MKWQHIGFVCIFVSGALREDTYGNSGFHIISSLKDGFQSLFDVFSVEEETVEIPHPVGKQRVTFHFFFGNITGTDRAAAVGQQNVKITSVIRHIENSLIFRDILFTDDGDLGTCDPQDKFKYGLYHTQRADILGHWRELADDPFHQKNRDRQHQISDDNDTDKYKSNHVFCPFYIVMQFCILTPLYEEFSIVAINLSRIT